MERFCLSLHGELGLRISTCGGALAEMEQNVGTLEAEKARQREPHANAPVPRKGFGCPPAVEPLKKLPSASL
jgi:hypothetical protein